MALPLVRRGLVHHWRVNVAVVGGVAAAAAVLGGALLVGESVRGSLRDLALRRLGGVGTAVRAMRFVSEDLAAALARSGTATAPVIAATGVVTEESGGRRASRVLVYGVDDRYWALQGVAARGPRERDALLGDALAAELGATEGATLLLTVEKPSSIPSSSLFGRRDDLARTLRVTMAGTVAAGEGGELALDPRQQSVRAVFVPLALLQRTLEQPGRVDTILAAAGPTAGAVAEGVRAAASLDDVGLRVRPVDGGRSVAIETATGLVDDATAQAARAAAGDAGASAAGVLTYLANSIRANGREVPYSVVAAVDDGLLAGLGVPVAGERSIVLNDWTARELRAAPGDRVTLEYYLWREEGRLETASAEFVVAGVVPMSGLAADRDLVPEYPGITTSERLADWDPPFPIDLGRVRPVDEEYWARHRATPKAFLPLAAGQQLWSHRLGRLTSVRVTGSDAQAVGTALRRRLDPLALGLTVDPVRERALASAEGATDFGEYFTYFSFFLVVAALLLAVLFFRLGLERRAAELGLLRALGFTPGALRRVHLAEAAVLAVAGALLGAAGAAGWAALLVTALRTWWIGAVGTEAITLHLAATPIVLGAGAVAACALAAAAWTLRDLGRVSPRALLAGEVRPAFHVARARWTVPAVLLALAAALAAVTWRGTIPAVAGFFGSAALLLAAALTATRTLLLTGAGAEVPSGATGIARLGWRGARHRPGRSVASVALVAFATFVVVSVGAFRRDAGDAAGSGGYALLAESIVPLHHDLATVEGRQAAGLDAEWPVRRLARFHVKEGDDASCLNLYRPSNPRVIAPERRFLDAGGFRFQRALAATDAEKANPWLLIAKDEGPGAPVPVIADAASMEYVLHKKVGEELTLDRPGAEPIRLRLVGALADSVFQSELVMGEDAFKRLFPDRAGYRLLLLDAAGAEEPGVVTSLESAFADQGLDVVAARDRLAAFHRVENTYLSTFQALGGLGLLLGTVGLGTLLFRNALERRREIALLRAVGYRPGQVSAMLVAENAALLALGVGAGIVAALAAVVPAVQRTGGGVPWTSLLAVAGAVLVTGLVTSAIAAAVVRRAPLIPALRSE